MTGVHGRFLLTAIGADVQLVNPQFKNIDDTQIDYLSHQVPIITNQSLSLFSDVSTHERIEKSGVTKDALQEEIERKAKDTAEALRHYSEPAKNFAGFDMETKSRWDSALAKIFGVANISTIDVETVKTFYSKFIDYDNEATPTNVKALIEHIFAVFTNQDETIDYGSLNENLDVIQWASSIFGETSGQMIKELVVAEERLQENPDKLVEELKAGTPRRINRIEPDSEEEKLLYFVYDHSQPIVVEEPQAPAPEPKEAPPIQETPAAATAPPARTTPPIEAKPALPEPKTFKEIIQLIKNEFGQGKEGLTFKVTEQGALSLITSVLPMLESKAKIGPIKMVEIKLGADPQIEIKNKQANGSLPITLKVKSQGDRQFQLNFRLGNTSETEVNFQQIIVTPSTTLPIINQDAASFIRSQLDANPLGKIIIGALQGQLGGKKAEIEIYGLDLQFTDDDKLRVFITGESKKKKKQ